MNGLKYLQVSLELDELLNKKMPNGSYILKKQDRILVINASILLRKLYEDMNKNG